MTDKEITERLNSYHGEVVALAAAVSLSLDVETRRKLRQLIKVSTEHPPQELEELLGTEEFGESFRAMLARVMLLSEVLAALKLLDDVDD